MWAVFMYTTGTLALVGLVTILAGWLSEKYGYEPKVK